MAIYIGTQPKDIDWEVFKRKHLIFAFPCFGRANEFMHNFVESEHHFIHGLQCHSDVLKFVEDFNNTMEHIQIVVRRISSRPQKMWGYGGGDAGYQVVKGYFFEVVFDERYDRQTQWCMTTPLQQLLRTFSPLYPWCLIYNTPDLKEVLKSHKTERTGTSSVWAKNPIKYEEFVKYFNDPDFMNKVIKDHYSYINPNNYTGYPIGTRLCTMVRSIAQAQMS